MSSTASASSSTAVLGSPSAVLSPGTEGTCWTLAIKIFNTTMTKDPSKMIMSSSPSLAIRPLTSGDILQAAVDAKESHDSKRSVFRSRMEKLVTILDQYARPIDVMIQHQPHITALVWGSIRTLLTIAVREIEISDEIGSALVRIVNEIGRWERYLQIYQNAQRFRASAAELFAHIINYLVRAKVYYDEPTSVRYARAAVAPSGSKLHRILTNIDRLSQQLEKEAELASAEYLFIDRQERKVHHELENQELLKQQAFRIDVTSSLVTNSDAQDTIRASLLTLSKTQEGILNVQTEQLNMALQESRKRSILDWLGGMGIASQAYTTARAAGTCEWIFTHKDYVLWTSTGYKGALWIHGIPGCGKSVIATFLTESAKTKLVLTHFFRASTNETSTRAISLTASMLLQWLRVEDLHEKHHYAAVLRLVQSLLPTVASYANCPFQKLWPILEYALEQTSDFTMVVDALDESRSENDSFELWRRLSYIGSLKNSQVILLSRYRDDLDKQLLQRLELRMDAQTMMPDILLFVAKEIENTPTLQPLRDDILRKAEAGADGMFLWARMMIDYIKLAATHRAQRNRLQGFPRGLSAIYEKFLEETATSLDDDEKILRTKIYKLLVCAKRPLSIYEISTALALHKPNAPMSTDDLLIDPSFQIHRFCWPLVNVIDEHAILVHKSVQDFLLCREGSSNTAMRLQESDCEEFVSRKCLYRLMHDDLMSEAIMRPIFDNTLLATSTQDIIPFVLPAEWSLYSYACDYWHQHISRAAPSLLLLELVARFLVCREFVIWSESYLRQREDMGPILETQAALRAWHSSLIPDNRLLIPIELFFEKAYQTVFDEKRVIITDRALAYTILRRLGEFYNFITHDKPRISIRKQIMEGFQEVLGPDHVATLRTVTEYLIEEIHPYGTSALEQAFKTNMETQRRVCPKDVSDSYFTGIMLGLCQFSLMRYEDALVTFRESAEGMHRILGPMRRNFLKARMNYGKTLEYVGQVEDAVSVFLDVYNTWKAVQGPENPLTLFSQAFLAAALRKLGRYEESERHTMECLAYRQRIFGMAAVTLDTMVHAAVVLRERKRTEEAFAYLDLASTHIGDGTRIDIGVERAHQIEHIRALLHEDLGDAARATRILEDVLDEARKNHLPQCGELMWMRLTLARILRGHGAFEAAESLFVGLTKPIKGNGANHEYDESTQAIIAEGAVRLAQQHDVQGANSYLRRHSLEWQQDDIFRVILGGPHVETEWHPPFAHVPQSAQAEAGASPSS